MRNLVRNALIAAIYVAFTSLWGWAATGPTVNIRLATSLYALAAFDPALIWGPALGNGLSTLLSGTPIDAALGVLVGLLAGYVAWMLGRWLGKWAAPLAVAVVPTLFVPLWLSVLYHAPLFTTYSAVGLGQCLSAIAAWLVVLPLGRRLLAQP